MKTGEIYLVKRNTWTGTYYVYRFGRPITLTKHIGVNIKKFMEMAKFEVKYNFEIWK